MMNSDDFTEGSTQKYCIFCGNQPRGKNKEHVFPKWLIKLTGDQKRVSTFQRSAFTNGFPDLKIAFDQFTFPACRECNSAYAQLEDKTKPVLEAVLSCNALSGPQVDTLLDWFDKVRRGLWHAQHILSKNELDLTPTAFINSQVAAQDRALILYRTDSTRKQLLTDSPNISFGYSPQALVLSINNLQLCLISAETF